MAKSIWGSYKSKKEVGRKEYLRMVKRIRYFIMLGFGMSFAVFVGIALFGGIYRVFDVLITAKLYIYAIAFVLVFAGFMIRFVKWDYFLKKLGVRIRLKENIITYLSLYSMNLTPGRVGRVVSAYTVSRITGEKTSKIVPAVMMDIFTDFIGFAIFALLFGLYFHRFVLYIMIADVVLLLPFLFLTHDWLYRRIKNMLKRFKRKSYLGLFSIYGDEYFSAQSSLNTLKTYLVSLSITLPADFLNASALILTLYSLGVTAPFSGTIFAYSSSYLFGMISGLPGGIGVNDASLVAIIGSIFGLNSILSSAATIMTRIATLWFGVVVGTVFLFYSMRYWRKNAGKRSAKK